MKPKYLMNQISPQNKAALDNKEQQSPDLSAFKPKNKFTLPHQEGNVIQMGQAYTLSPRIGKLSPTAIAKANSNTGNNTRRDGDQ